MENDTSRWIPFGPERYFRRLPDRSFEIVLADGGSPIKYVPTPDEALRLHEAFDAMERER